MPLTDSQLSRIDARSVSLAGEEAAVVEAVLALLIDLEEELRREIGAAYVTGETRKTHRQVRLRALLDQTTGSIAAAYRQIGIMSNQHLQRTAAAELTFSHGLLDSIVRPLASIGVEINTVAVTPNLLKALARDTVVNMGESLGAAPMHAWLSSQSEVVQAATTQQIRRGIQIGEGTREMVRRVQGPLDAAKHTVESIVRTSTQAVVNEADMRVYEKNRDVVKGVYQISILDKRTSLICVAYAGKRWRYDDAGDLIPVGHSLAFRGGTPRHLRCRSKTVPWPKSWQEMDLAAGSVSPQLRRILDGGIVTRDGDKLLMAASEETRQSVLGTTRHRLWKKGELNVDDLVKNGRPTTVEDLTG